MPAKISEEVTDVGGSCRYLRTALTQHGDQVSDSHLENVRPYQQEGDPDPGFSASNVAMERRLGGSMDALEGADKKVFELNAEVSSLRKERDELKPKLSTEIARLGRTIRGQYLAPDMEGLALKSPKSRSLDSLVRQADMIDTAFNGDKLEKMLGESAYQGTKVDPKEAAARPVTIGRRLRSTKLELEEKQRLLDAAIIEKDRLMAEHGVIFVYTARSFEAQCRLAGFKKLAGKVRPSVHRPGRRAVEVGEEDDLDLSADHPPVDNPPADDPLTDTPSDQDDVADPSP